MFAILFTIGIPWALSGMCAKPANHGIRAHASFIVELRTSPILYVLRSAAAATRQALLDTDAQPKGVRGAWRLAWGWLAACVMTLLTGYCIVSEVIRIPFAILAEAFHIIVTRSIAAACSSAKAYVEEAIARKTFAAWSECVRKYCCAESGPFEYNSAPAPTAIDISSIPLARALGKDFRPEMWFWELVVMTRKVAILVPVLFASKYAEFQVSSCRDLRILFWLISWHGAGNLCAGRAIHLNSVANEVPSIQRYSSQSTGIRRTVLFLSRHSMWHPVSGCALPLRPTCVPVRECRSGTQGTSCIH